MNQDKEVQEAIVAGREALSAIEEARSALSQANDASWLDILGGGILTDLFKYKKINNTQEILVEVREKLTAFIDEYNDVDNLKLPDLDISFGMQLFDMGFDNVISDFMVKSKINKAQVELMHLRDQIEAAVRKLEAM